MAVMLDLVQPALAVQRLGAGGNDLQGDALKEIGRNRASGNGKVGMGLGFMGNHLGWRDWVLVGFLVSFGITAEAIAISAYLL